MLRFLDLMVVLAQTQLLEAGFADFLVHMSSRVPAESSIQSVFDRERFVTGLRGRGQNREREDGDCQTDEPQMNQEVPTLPQVIPRLTQ